jgi:hypothetical protein
LSRPILVVGGDAVFVQNVFAAKLQEVGITVGWIWDRHMNPQYQVPPGCGGIVILKSAIGHGMADSAAAMARDAGVPWIRTEHRFSKALPLLRAAGMVAPVVKDSEATPTPEEKYEVILAYLQQELDKGRSPSRGELRGVIKRAFGPHLGVSDTIVAKARGVAAATQTRPPKPEAPMSQPAEQIHADNSEVQPSQLTEWALLLIEDRPEDPPEKWVARLKDLTVGVLPPDSILTDLVTNLHAEQWKQWESPPKEKWEAFEAMRKAWARRFLSAYLDEHGEPSPYAAVREASRKVFPRGLHNTTIKELRMEVSRGRGLFVPAPVPDIPEETPTQESVPKHTGRYPPSRISEAVAFAKGWRKALTSTEAALMRNWVGRIMRNPHKARTSDGLRGLFVSFQRRPLEFVGAFLLSIPQGKQVTRSMIRAAYKKVLRAELNNRTVAPMAEALQLSHCLTTTVPSVPSESEEGFFRSLHDAYNYYLGHAVEHIGRRTFRKLLEDGHIEAHREGRGRYAPWMVSTASVDRYLSNMDTASVKDSPAGDTQEPTAEVTQLQAKLEEAEAALAELATEKGQLQAKLADWVLRSHGHMALWKAPDIVQALGENLTQDDGPDLDAIRKSILALKDRADRHNALRENWKEKALEARKENALMTDNLRASQRLLAAREVEVAALTAERSQTLDALKESRRQHDQTLLRLNAALTNLDALTKTEEEATDEIPLSVEPQAEAPAQDLIQQVMAMGYRIIIEPAT